MQKAHVYIHLNIHTQSPQGKNRNLLLCISDTASPSAVHTAVVQWRCVVYEIVKSIGSKAQQPFIKNPIRATYTETN